MVKNFGSFDKQVYFNILVFKNPKKFFYRKKKVGKIPKFLERPTKVNPNFLRLKFQYKTYFKFSG